jgi:hypothetical protein
VDDPDREEDRAGNEEAQSRSSAQSTMWVSQAE